MEDLCRGSTNGGMIGSIIFVGGKAEETVPIREAFIGMNAEEAFDGGMTPLQGADSL